MGDSILLNDGSSFLVLNDGSSTILLNAHEAGINIRGRQAGQQVGRPQQLIPVEFTFQLLAHTIPRAIIQLMSIGKVLLPKGIYNEALRDSFRLKLTDMKQKITKLAEKAYLEESMKFMINENMDDILTGKVLLKSFKEVFKKWKKHSK